MSNQELPGGVTIRREREPDFDTVHDLVADAFESATEARLVRAIRASPGYVPELALVAVLDQQIVGHVMISEATLATNDGEQRIVMLAPLAVAPSSQGSGIGAALVRAAVNAAGDRGEPLVVLEGSPRYYSRLGFEPAMRHGIEMPLPDWAPTAAAQVYYLSTAGRSLRGRVIYPAAFDGLD